MVVTLRVEIQELSYILAALQEIPAKIANPLTEKLVKQANEQTAKSEVSPVESPVDEN